MPLRKILVPSKSIAVAALILCLSVFINLPHVAQTASGTVTPPSMVGWGGSRLIENENHLGAAIPSIVFPGESASDQEILARSIVQSGSNAMRVSFAPYCTNPDGFLSRYNSTRLERAIRIAETFDLWIIVDYHGYSDVFNTTTIANGETVQQCWLNFWSGVTSQFSNGYSQIIWEPENEPAYCPNHAGTNLSQGCFNNNNATAAMSTLNSEYQAFINQTRSQGDSHWIVVQNICSYACSFCPTYNGDCLGAVLGYPRVTDPLDRIFISLHPYMSYQVYQNTWNDTSAENIANEFYNTMVSGTQTTGFPVLNTEGGPGATERTNGTPKSCPDPVLNGSSGYCKTNLHFIQTLTSLLENNALQRINWLWWPAGDWSSSPGAGALGALAPGGYAEQITWQRFATYSLVLNSSGAGSTFPAAGNYSFIAGTIVNISAIPQSNNTLAQWLVENNQVSSNNPLLLQMNSDQSVTAIFAPIVHMIVVADLSSANATTLGSNVQINVSIKNEGNIIETFNVTVYANQTAIGSKPVANLSVHEVRVVPFLWNTEGWRAGNYVIAAVAGPVDGMPGSGASLTKTVEILPSSSISGPWVALLSAVSANIVYVIFLGSVLLGTIMTATIRRRSRARVQPVGR